MRSICTAFALTLAVAAARADDTHRYANKELGVRFSGPVGWEVERAEGTGAWTTLTTYKHGAYESTEVKLQVRNNVLRSYENFKKSLEAEFQASKGDKIEPGQTLLKDVVFENVKMKRGAKLPGIQVTATTTAISDEGKKREHRILVRTYYGKHRLFRVSATVRRVRYKKVKTDFEQALEGLTIDAAQEAVQLGTPFQSRRAGYSCLVPEGYRVVVPPRNFKNDIRFKGADVDLLVYCFSYRGDSRDHLDMMLDFYEDELTVENEEAKVLGKKGFAGTLKQAKYNTYVVGSVVRGKAVRIHAVYKGDKEVAAKKAVEGLLKGFKVG